MYKKTISSNKLFISFLLLIAISCSIKIFSTFYKDNSNDVFNISKEDSVVHEDLNGDNKKDNILIKKSDSGLIAQVDLNDDSTYSLNYNKNFETLGEFAEYWPIRISTLDISRDNSKEIFIQSSFHNKPIQHIFSWNGSEYNDMFCSNNNIIGFIDSANSRTSKVMSGNYESGNITLKGYLYNNGSLKEFTSNLNNYLPGNDTISNFISLIESLPNPYLTIPNYFYSQISGTDLESLYRLANKSNYYKYQDGYFTDLSWDKDGNITCENWILNFRTTSTLDSTSFSNITINLMLNKYTDDNFPFKITSINIY